MPIYLKEGVNLVSLNNNHVIILACYCRVWLAYFLLVETRVVSLLKHDFFIRKSHRVGYWSRLIAQLIRVGAKKLVRGIDALS